jgi:hypothetical protein
VQLQPDPRSGASASDVASARNARCLGALAEKRWGVVVHPGVERGGIHRNILVKKSGKKSELSSVYYGKSLYIDF